MKISTKVEYGLIALIDIAMNSEGGKVVTVLSISERQGISKNYLDQILTPLRQAGIINGIKGAQGGYTIVDEPKKIKLSTILNALDSNLLKVTFDNSMNCNENSTNVLKTCIWDEMHKNINKFVEKITLEDLVEEYRSGLNKSIMFYI